MAQHALWSARLLPRDLDLHALLEGAWLAPLAGDAHPFALTLNGAAAKPIVYLLYGITDAESIQAQIAAAALRLHAAVWRHVAPGVDPPAALAASPPIPWPFRCDPVAAVRRQYARALLAALARRAAWLYGAQPGLAAGQAPPISTLRRG